MMLLCNISLVEDFMLKTGVVVKQLRFKWLDMMI